MTQIRPSWSNPKQASNGQQGRVAAGTDRARLASQPACNTIKSG